MSRYNSIAVLRSIFCTVMYQEGRPNCGYLYGNADLKIKYWSIRVDVCQMNTNWHRVSVAVTRMARSGSESVSAQLGGFRDRNCQPSLSQTSTGLAACEHPRRRSWRSGVEARKIEGSIAEPHWHPRACSIGGSIYSNQHAFRHSDCLCTEVMKSTTV